VEKPNQVSLGGIRIMMCWAVLAFYEEAPVLVLGKTLEWI
jgi:hypothetical protein